MQLSSPPYTLTVPTIGPIVLRDGSVATLRLAQASLHLRRHPSGCIGHREGHVGARLHSPVRLRIGLVEIDVRRLDRQYAVSIVNMPPLGMASHAFTARFITTCSTCPRSAFTGASSGRRASTTFILQ